MARKFFVLLLAVSLALAGCGAPDTQTQQGGNDDGKQSPAKQIPRAERDAPDRREPRAEGANAGADERKPKSPHAPEPKPEPADELVTQPEPAPSADAAASVSASSSASASASGGGRGAIGVTVSRVVDGDTVEISPAVDGINEVRLIGVDTPETKDPEEGVEPYGSEASAFATDQLTGQDVGLEFDVEREDRYGRLLAYVYVGGEMFNEDLVEEGYAQAYPYEPNTRYEARFAAAQEEARATGLGIWGLPLDEQCELADRGNGVGEGTPGCAGTEAGGTVSPSATSSASSPAAPASASPSASPSAPPSGRNGGTPAGGDIDCDKVDSPIPTPPGDPDNLDGDGDGLACE